MAIGILPSLVQAVPLNWSTVASLPTLRRAAAVVETGGLIYVVGGFDAANGSLGTFEAYDPQTDAWTALPSMPTPRAFLAAAVAGTTIFAIGGVVNGLGEQSAVEAYDIASGIWTAVSSLPAAEGDMAAASVGGQIFCFGGGLGDDVLIYDPVNDGWSSGTPMPTARVGARATVLGGQIFVVGGFSGAPLSVTEVYDPVGDSWTTVAGMSTPRGHFGIATVGGTIYVAAGEGPIITNFLATVEAYDSVTDTWTAETPLAAVRDELGLAAVNGVLFAVGGGAGSGPPLSSLNERGCLAPPPVPPVLGVTVSTTRFSYSAGEAIIYTIDYQNTGGDTAINVSIWDSWTPGIAFVSASNGGVGAASMVSWTIPPVPPGATGSVSFVLQAPSVPNGTFACGDVGQSAALADYADSCGAQQTTAVSAAWQVEFRNAVVSLTKRSSESSVSQGSPATFTITAINTCNDSAVNVQIWDTLPADYTFVTMPMVPGGIYNPGLRLVAFSPFTLARAGLSGSVYAVSFTASATGAGSAMCPNTASASYANEGPIQQPTVLSNAVCVALLVPHLKVTITGPPDAQTDAQFSFVLTLSNATGLATAYNVVLVDTLPSALRLVSATGGPTAAGQVIAWSVPDIPPGGSASYTVMVKGPGGEATLSLTNAAHVTYASGGGGAQPDQADSHGTYSITLTPVLVPRVYPTPFEPAIAIGGTLKFSGLESGATVRIYTVSGALVRALAGVVTHRLEWDGRDANGAPAAAGMYFYAVLNPNATGTGAKTAKGSFGVIR